MRLKYTPGPWSVIDKSIGGAYQVVNLEKEGSLRICTVTNAPRDEANAYLIAAAPDMFRALKLIDKAGENSYTGEVMLTHEMWEAISAALAMARGNDAPVRVSEPEDHTDDVCPCGDVDCARPFGHEE